MGRNPAAIASADRGLCGMWCSMQRPCGLAPDCDGEASRRSRGTPRGRAAHSWSVEASKHGSGSLPQNLTGGASPRPCSLDAYDELSGACSLPAAVAPLLAATPSSLLLPRAPAPSRPWDKGALARGTKVTVLASPYAGRTGIVESVDEDGDPRVSLDDHDGHTKVICVDHRDVALLSATPSFGRATAPAEAVAVPSPSPRNADIAFGGSFYAGGTFVAVADGGVDKTGLSATNVAGAVVVGRISPAGCWADAAGLLPGDVLLEVNGIPTGAMSRQEFAASLREVRPLRFTVGRDWASRRDPEPGEIAEVAIIEKGVWVPCEIEGYVAASDTWRLRVYGDQAIEMPKRYVRKSVAGEQAGSSVFSDPWPAQRQGGSSAISSPWMG